MATLFFSCVPNQFIFHKLEAGESNDTRRLILRNLLRIYERKNRKTRCMPASVVQNHVQKFEGRVSRRPLNARLRSSPSRIQDSIRELPDRNVLSGSTRRGWVPRHALVQHDLFLSYESKTDLHRLPNQSAKTSRFVHYLDQLLKAESQEMTCPS
jgi:hypothetical protein